MKRSLFSVGLFIFLLLGIFSCSDHIVPDFYYTPEMPKRGETVTFTNTTTGDDDWTAKSWAWKFGDGYTSVSESPTHKYVKSGFYSVKLMVDSNKNVTKTVKLAVYDTIPRIYIDKDSLILNQKTTFDVLAYNPYSEDVTYKWTFSENAVGADLDENQQTDVEDPAVYFKIRNVNEIVKLHIEIGDSVYDVADTFFVYDAKCRSILMAQKNGNILRQRILNFDLEDYTDLGVSAGKHPFNLSAKNNNLYVFDAGSNVAYNSNWATNTSGDGSIKVVDMSDNTSRTLISNQGTSSYFGFYNGYVDDNYVYWTDYSDFVYRTPINSTLGTFTWNGSEDAQTAVPYYLVKANRLGYYGNGLSTGQFSGGVYVYDQAYFWAKGGSGTGIYRFMDSDILSSNSTGNVAAPALGAILTDYSIRAFAVDEINQKIYFSVTAPASKVGFWVANISGSGATRIDDAPMDDASLYISGIVVDNLSNKVYWAYRSPETVGASAPGGVSWESYYEAHPTHKSGVKMATLATLFKPAGSIEYFREGVIVYGLGLDDVAK